MSTIPASTLTPETPPPAPPSLGGLRELLLFLLSALALLFGIQLLAIHLLAWLALRQTPGRDWAGLLREVSERSQSDAFVLVPVQFIAYILLLFLLYALVRLHRRLPFWTSLALRPLPWSQVPPALIAGVLLAFFVQFASNLIPPPEPLALDRLFSSRAAAQLIVAASLLLAPFVEEIIFRGYIYTLLERLWGMGPAVAASGLLFGAIHVPQLWPGYFQMALLCLVGVVFALSRAQSGNTTVSILLHFGYNATISGLFLLSPTFRALPALF